MIRVAKGDDRSAAALERDEDVAVRGDHDVTRRADPVGKDRCTKASRQREARVLRGAGARGNGIEPRRGRIARADRLRRRDAAVTSGPTNEQLS